MMEYISHEQTIHAIKSEYPTLIHGKDFWVGQPVKENSAEYLGDAFIAAWNVEGVEQPDEATVAGLITKYQAAWDALPKEPVPDEISRRQFFQQLAVMSIISQQEALAALQTGAIPAPLQAIIDQLPTEDDKFNAQMLVIGASTFNRTHPLAEIVRQAMQWTVEQKDEFWIEAAKH